MKVFLVVVDQIFKKADTCRYCTRSRDMEERGAISAAVHYQKVRY